MAPFRWEAYQSNPNTILALMGKPAAARADAQREIGRIASQGAFNSGAIAAQTAQQVGAIGANTILDYAKGRQEQQLQQQAVQQQRALGAGLQAVLSGQAPPEALLQFGEPGVKLLGGVKAVQELAAGQVKDARETAGRLSAAMDVLPEEQRAPLYKQLRPYLVKGGLGTEADIPQDYTPDYHKAVSAWVAGPQNPAEPKTPGVHWIQQKQADGSTKWVSVADTAGQTVGGDAAPVPKTKPVYRMSPDKQSIEKVTDLPADAQVIQEAQPPRVTVNTGAGGRVELSKDATELAAALYRVTNSLPTRFDDNDKKRIMNVAADQARALGQTPAQTVQKQAAFKADGQALGRMTTMKSAAESFEAKALAQSDKVVELSRNVPRSKWPILNKAILAGKTEIVGDPDATLFLNAALTFTSEYAKIIEGSTGSAAGSSDAARKATEKLLNPKYNHGTVAKAVDLMKWEMRQTIIGYDATIGHITERMGGTPATPGGDSGGGRGGGSFGLSYQDYLKSKGK